MNIFNNDIEIGLRLLILLNYERDLSFNIERLTYYDHLLLHSGDIENGPKSLFPDSPFRFFEYHVNKEKITSAIDFLWRRDLIDVEYKETGIYYKANRLTKMFLDSFNSKLYYEIKDISKWIIERFKTYSIENLKILFNDKVKSKSGNFSSIGMVKE